MKHLCLCLSVYTITQKYRVEEKNEYIAENQTCSEEFDIGHGLMKVKVKEGLLSQFKLTNYNLGKKLKLHLN